MSKIFKIKSNSSFWILMGQSVSLLGLLIGLRLISYYVDPYDFGLFTLSYSIMIFFKNLFVQPFLAFVLRYIPEKNSIEESLLILNHTLKNKVIFSLFFSAITFLVSLLLNIKLLYTISLILFAFITDSVKDYFRSNENAIKNFYKMAFFSIIPNFFKAIFGVLIYIKMPEYQSLLLGLIASNIFAITIIGRKNFISLIKAKTSNKLDFEECKKFILPLIPHKFSTWFFTYIDKYIILLLLGPTTVGLYTPIYNLVYQVYWFIHESLMLKFRPYFYEKLSENKIQKAKSILHKQLKISLIIYIILGFLLFTTMPKYLLELIISEKYLILVDIIPLLGIALAIQMIGYVMEMVFYGFKKTFTVFQLQFISSIILLATSSFFAINYGIQGLIFSMVLSYTAYLFLCIQRVRRIFN